MSTIQPYRPNPIEQRRVGRALERLAIETGLTIACIEAQAEEDAAVIDGIAYVSHRAKQHVALDTQQEQQLCMAVPMATDRLQAIGDIAALSMADVVAGSSRRMSRR
jgi:hypothetical protein